MTVNVRSACRHLGQLVFILVGVIVGVAVFSGVSLAAGAADERTAMDSLLLSAGIGLGIGFLLYLPGRREAGHFGQREALLLVAAAWLIGAGIAALPYWTWAAMRPESGTIAHDFDTYTNCYFEAMSGLTTTGATVVQSLATLPRSLLLWRALTQWMGGLGIVVLFVAVLPILGVGGRRIYGIESPGPRPEGVTPRIQDAARILWLIYLGLTVAQVLALRLFGMSWFDATCHTFATLATGGFSTQDSSLGGFASTAVHVVVIVFMVLAGVNFSVYYQLLRRQWRSVLRDTELRAYLAIMLAGTVIVGVSLWNSTAAAAEAGILHPSAGHVVRDAAFQVVSIQTTTGFCTADFDTWGFVAKATLVVLMFIGGSAGSTGGGIKVVRVLVVVRVMLAEIEHVFRPNVVRTLKIGRRTIEPEMKINTLVYILGIAALFAAGTVGLMIIESGQGIDITTAATASAATLNNIGPGLARVGATHNYSWFSDMSKWLMSALMVLGRLEVYTLIVLFQPKFWRSE